MAESGNGNSLNRIKVVIKEKALNTCDCAVEYQSKIIEYTIAWPHGVLNKLDDCSGQAFREGKEHLQENCTWTS